jgi:hypothetical protein
MSPLRRFAEDFGVHAVRHELPQPGLPSKAVDDGRDVPPTTSLDYESPPGAWQALPSAGAAKEPPRRFVDGSVVSRTIGVVRVGGRSRPLLIACAGAAALELDGRRLARRPKDVVVEPLVCLLAQGIGEDALAALSSGVQNLGMTLISSPARIEAGVDFETLRRRTFDLAKRRMEAAETKLTIRGGQTPSLIDGLLERRLTTAATQTLPVYGFVKRQLRSYLPADLAEGVIALRQGERSPAFLVHSKNGDFVSWYLRLHAPADSTPGAGLVRISTAAAYLEKRFAPRDGPSEISAVSAALVAMRHRQRSYSRMPNSIEPIVCVEDSLRAMMPDLDQLTARVHRAMHL